MQGNPATFASLISSSNLQVGGLIVSNTWVYGDIVDLEIRTSNGLPCVTLWGETSRPHLIQGSTDFTNWTSLATNLPVNSQLDYLETNSVDLRERFYRGLKP